MTAATSRFAGHTPEPWVWVDAAPFEGPMESLVGAGGVEVCNFGDSTQYYPSEGRAPDKPDARLIAAAPTILAERDRLATALGALGVMGDGYCFCSDNRDPDKADHQPECVDARAALAGVTV